MSDLLVSIIESLAGAAASAAEYKRDPNKPKSPKRRPPVIARAATPVAFQPWNPPQLEAGLAELPPLEPLPPLDAPVVRPRGRAAPPAPPPTRRLDPASLFSNSDGIMRSVLAAEILGPPVALRRQNLWDDPRV